MMYEIWLEAPDTEKTAVVAILTAAGIPDAGARFDARATTAVYSNAIRNPTQSLWTWLRAKLAASSLTAKVYFG